MSVSSQASCLKHININMKKWAQCTGRPVGEEPADTAAPCSSLSGFVGSGRVITLSQVDRVTNRPTRLNVHIGEEEGLGLRIPLLPFPVLLSLPVGPEPQGLTLLCSPSTMGSASGLLTALHASVGNSVSQWNEHGLCHLTDPATC